MPTIGVVHSVHLSNRFKANFTQALAHSGWSAGTYNVVWPAHDNDGHYGRKANGTPDNSLETVVTSYVNQNVNLIVAAGGLVSALAAYKVIHPLANRTPVVALVGRQPVQGETGHTELGDTTVFPHGGIVYLDVNTGCVARRDALVAAFPGQVSNATIGLMVNANSSMSDGEINSWHTGGQNIVLKFPDLANNARDNNFAHFGPFFTAAKTQNPGLTGIVVSADPYFYTYRTQLMTADQVLKISFPITNYAYKDDGSPIHAWNPNLHTISGAVDMLSKYYALGAAAGAVLSASRIDRK
jgi:hypothetical protein